MAYTGGTLAAKKCISELTSMGALVDVYSKDWLSENSNLVNYSIEDLLDFQQQSSGACEGHLLVISTSRNLEIVSKLLVDAYLGFEEHFGERAQMHRADLIFINLATQQVLCVGLGRKNYFFGFAIDSKEVTINEGNVRGIIESCDKPKSNIETLEFMNNFLKYDYGNIVKWLMEGLYEFGSCARNWDYLPLTPDQIKKIIAQEPDDDGMYDIDGDLMSLEDAKQLIAEFDEAESWGNENLSIIQDFFPDLTWGDLNTCDY